ncbi:Alkylhydroperoxidase family enzyme, contains CxxC motif [Sphingobium faniae]|nr:Alkylhydroperoxidase family enzyme, contains CxxC motif [Sphingobium faniae]
MRIEPVEGREEIPTGLLGTIYAPEIGRAAMEYSRVTYAASRLSLREFEAARVVTAYINGCQLCQNWRSAVDLPLYLKSLGEDGTPSVANNGPAPDDDFYRAIATWRDATLFSPREKIAMELAEGMGEKPKKIAADEEFWARARALYSDAEIVDLSYCIACWMGLGRMTHVLGLDGICGLPSAAPGSAAG